MTILRVFSTILANLAVANTIGLLPIVVIELASRLRYVVCKFFDDFEISDVSG